VVWSLQLSLSDDWNCSAGATWRTTGLNCDVEADVYNEDDISAKDESYDEDNAPVVSQTREGTSVAWVECVLCTNILPRGVEPTTIPDDWNCRAGATWRTTGLTCDVDADVYIEDDTSGEDEWWCRQRDHTTVCMRGGNFMEHFLAKDNKKDKKKFNKEKKKTKKKKKIKSKRGPHWVVQPCCRRFNSAGPRQSS
jgi:hypothetical protein